MGFSLHVYSFCNKVFRALMSESCLSLKWLTGLQTGTCRHGSGSFQSIPAQCCMHLMQASLNHVSLTCCICFVSRNKCRIFDAWQLPSGPIARLALPDALPHQLHGNWSNVYHGPDQWFLHTDVNTCDSPLMCTPPWTYVAIHSCVESQKDTQDSIAWPVRLVTVCIRSLDQFQMARPLGSRYVVHSSPILSPIMYGLQ